MVGGSGMLFHPRGIQLATTFIAPQTFSTRCSLGKPTRPIGIELHNKYSVNSIFPSLWLLMKCNRDQGT